jgi:hypothetical protein
MDIIIKNEKENKQWTHMLNDLQRNKLGYTNVKIHIVQEKTFTCK